MAFLFNVSFVLGMVFSTISGYADIRGSSAPFISGDTFRAFAQHVFDETTPDFDPTAVKYGDIIFVKTDWEHLDRFFALYHPQIPHAYVLVTHNSDHSAPGPFGGYLDSPKLLGWFAQNVEGLVHEKLHPIPIGIANKHHRHGNTDVFSALLSAGKNVNRPLLCYMNFVQDTCLQERTEVWNLFFDEPWCTHAPMKRFHHYLLDLSRSQFVLCPRGNGLDTHRIWESLLMGAIPIVLTSSLDSLYTDLPILIVQEWNLVTESLLREKYEEMHSKIYCSEKIFFNYWTKKIKLCTK